MAFGSPHAMVHGLRASVICVICVVSSRCSINTLPSPICSPIYDRFCNMSWIGVCVIIWYLKIQLFITILPYSMAIKLRDPVSIMSGLFGKGMKDHEKTKNDMLVNVGQCWSMLADHRGTSGGASAASWSTSSICPKVPRTRP